MTTQPSPATSLARYDAMSLAVFNAARRSHGLAPVPELPEPRHLSLVKDDGAVEA